MTLARLLYTALLALVAPLFWWQLAKRARREGGDWQILHPHRFGRRWTCRVGPAPVWVHAVSLGELRAVEPLLDQLLAQGLPVLLTHTTATARTAAAERFAAALGHGQLQQAWLPYDFPGAMRRFVAATQPRVLLLVEREVWPNLLAACHHAQVPVVLVNARLSSRSAQTMARLGIWMRPAISGLSAVLAQTADDAARLRALGAPVASVTGNLKFDLPPEPAAAGQGRHWHAAWQRPVVLLASTRDGEEERFLAAVRDAAGIANHPPGVPPPLWLVVPRHARRFDDVAALLRQAGVRWQRRSALVDPAALPPDCEWLLGDSMGEMAAYYAASDVALIGGSFEDFGSQNLLEACAAGVPVVVGPSIRHFAQAVADAVAAGAAKQVADPAEAVAVALAWLSEPAERRRHAQAGAAFVASHRGATARSLQLLAPWLHATPPAAQSNPLGPARPR